MKLPATMVWWRNLDISIFNQFWAISPLKIIAYIPSHTLRVDNTSFRHVPLMKTLQYRTNVSTWKENALACRISFLFFIYLLLPLIWYGSIGEWILYLGFIIISHSNWVSHTQNYGKKLPTTNANKFKWSYSSFEWMQGVVSTPIHLA